MPITVEWFPEPYIRHNVVTGVLTTSELDTWALGELAILNNYSHVIHSVTEVNYAAGSKVNVLALDSIKTLMRHPNSGWSMIVGTTPLVGFVTSMFQRITGMHFMPYDTVEQAQTYLLELIRIERERQQTST